MSSLLPTFLIATYLALPAALAGEKIEISVDPRGELIAIVFRLAGNDEYNRPQSNSPYADEVSEWFQKHSDHEAVTIAGDLCREAGVSFDSPMTLAVHLSHVPELELTMPLEPWPERLDRRWTAESIARFLPALRDFAKDSRFESFYRKHQRFYGALSKRLGETLADAELKEWAASYLGEGGDGSTFTLHIGPLQGGHNFGCGVAHADGRLDLCPILGVWEWDKRGDGIFGELHVPLAAHELTHSFANPLIDAHIGELSDAGGALLGTAPTKFREQAYDSPRIVLAESVVRACVLRYLESHQGEAAAIAMGKEDAARGFTWVPALAERLRDEYEADRERYPDLVSFAPRIVEFFQEIGAAVAAPAVPTIVAMTPTNGATDVDPNLPAITVTFSVPMVDGSWSVMKGRGAFPPVAGRPSYDRTRTRFTLPVKLEPNTDYTFGINGPSGNKFRSEAGMAVEPVVVTFRTGDS